MIDSSLFLGSLQKSKAVVDEILTNKELQNSIYAAIEMVVACFKNDKKLLFAGNGGVQPTLSICLLNMCLGLCLIARVFHL